MTEVRTARAGRLFQLAVDSALIAGMLIAVCAPPSAPAIPGRALAASVRPSLSTNSSAASLRVDPPSFWMHTGTNVTLRAIWSAGSPLCQANGLAYRWTLRGSNATGTLGTANTSSATFRAESFSSGLVLVSLSSTAALTCGPDRAVVVRTCTTNISVVAPLTIFPLNLSSLTPAPGQGVALGGAISGGTPPYDLRVNWGDGSTSLLYQAGPGPFSVNHSFPAGSFLPWVVGSDAEGALANASAPETISVGSGFRVAILSSSPVAEIGVPVDFGGESFDSPPGAVHLFDCANATVESLPPSGDAPNTTSFSCSFFSPGTAEVVFGSYSPYPGGPFASTVLYESVVLPPRVDVAVLPPFGEVGGVGLVGVQVSGGAAPITISWNLTGNRSGGSEVLDADGSGVLALPLGTAGVFSVGVRAVDALGGLGENTSAPVEVDPSLAVEANAGSTLGADGALVLVSGEVFGGCPSFSWWAVPSITSTNETGENGTLAVVGAFGWNGSYVKEGNLSIAVGLSDSCGVEWQTNLTVALVPPLVVVATASPGPASPNETLALNVTIDGGWAPYQLAVHTSENESWNRTILSDGVSHWLFPTTANGSLRVEISLNDSLGDAVNAEEMVTLTPPRTSPPPSDPPSTTEPPQFVTGPGNGTAEPTALDVGGLAVSFLVTFAGVAAGVVFLRRRVRRGRATGTPEGPDPEATLRKIIEPADGAERFTVELLAEEAGIPMSTVRSTIDRLVTTGKIRSESGADGEEVLSWS